MASAPGRWWAPAVGLLLIAAGVAIGLAAPSTGGIGWFGYEPLPEGVVLVARETAVAGSLVVLGLLVCVFVLGWRLSARRSG